VPQAFTGAGTDPAASRTGCATPAPRVAPRIDVNAFPARRGAAPGQGGRWINMLSRTVSRRAGRPGPAAIPLALLFLVVASAAADNLILPRDL
jgi:hypothetical protein